MLYNVKMISSYTDRPKRYIGEEGHIFLSKEEFDKLNKNKIISYTEFGSYRYCCLESDVKKINTYVIDEKELDILINKYKNKYYLYKVRIKRTT